MAITLMFPRSEFLIEDDVFPPLGLIYLATYLRDKGHEVQCLDMALGHTIDDIKYDIVGLSFTTPQRNAAYSMLETLKSRGKIVIAGGPHPTHMSEECIEKGFDFVVAKRWRY
jgi:radical SAM superfamily enzyme YgiQ (UPF0313 family)